MNKLMHSFLCCLIVTGASGIALADDYQLVTGVDVGLWPGADRPVFPVPGPGFPGTFNDGDRLAGTSPAGPPVTFQGTGTPVVGPNQFGSLSFMFRRGSIPTGPTGNVPLMSVDFLGGPLLDLDGDLGNGARSLIPVTGQDAVPIPGTSSFIGLNFDKQAGSVRLNNFDATSGNAGSAGNTAVQVVSVNTLAGTSPDGTLGAAINPTIDTRQGALTLIAPGVTRIDNLGYEIWQDSLDPGSSSPDVLGTMQFLGNMRGWLVERDPDTGLFPTLAGLGLGSTLWPLVDVSQVGNTFNTANGLAGGLATITDGNALDVFSVAGNGGLGLSDFGGDLGAYLDNVVAPRIDPLSQSFVYLESAGFGINNSFDPVFGDTNGYDIVLVAQSPPIPEPATLSLMLVAAGLVARRRRCR